jgi:magnesium transporter
MAIDDCVMDVNFPRVDDYDQYVYLAVHSARWDDTDPEPRIKELDILLGKNYLVTYHEEPTRGIARAQEVVARRGAVLARGPDHLLYLILDVMVDNYMPILEKIQTRVDEFEERVVRTPSKKLLRDVLHFKRAVAALRRIVGPQRDTMLALTRDEYAVIRPEMRPYLRDVYDRLARISDLLDSFRDELATMLDIYVSQVSNQLNEVMKVLTAITVVIAPITFVAGVFGMNVRFPGFDSRHAFYEAMAIMVLTAGAMIWYFRSRKWL